ncbi:VOC family protein [Tersicoccus sp. MR15.9]|uniref:VOC family protein n=1 Tax=Tersicoccus mangrovi TaxID=3121635 RepID=UPI002FE551B0
MAWLHTVIDVPADRLDAASAFWAAALGCPLGDPWPGHPEFRSLVPPTGDACVHVQRVGSDVPAVHLDLEVADLDAEVARLLALGATTGHREPNGAWQVLVSPGGLPVCVVAGREDHRRPDGVDVDGGVRERLVQVCIDAPADAVDAEVAFWRAAVPGRWAPSTSEGLIGKLHPGAGSTIKLLFQRLGEDTGPVRAHLDLGTTDVARDAERLERLGAARVHDSGRWTVLRDQAGLVFCTTPNDPDEELA